MKDILDPLLQNRNCPVYDLSFLKTSPIFQHKRSSSSVLQCSEKERASLRMKGVEREKNYVRQHVRVHMWKEFSWNPSQTHHAYRYRDLYHRWPYFMIVVHIFNANNKACIRITLVRRCSFLYLSFPTR